MPTAPPSPTSPGPTSPVPVTPVGPDVAALSFEDALSELERIVKGLEGGQQKLDDAIGAYERGTLLRRHCEAKLAEAESRCRRLSKEPTVRSASAPPTEEAPMTAPLVAPARRRRCSTGSACPTDLRNFSAEQLKAARRGAARRDD